jgi:hypothetical protein
VSRHKIYLIPGIFGFASLGGIGYFRRVRETLEDVFRRRGLEVDIIDVKALPTASVRHRARRVLRTISETGGLDEGVHVHLVAHSLGALDARLVGCTTASLDMDDIRAALTPNLRTIVSLSGPHYGTPLANFFTTIYGKNLLYLVTLLIIVGLWRRPITMLGGFMGIVGKVNDLLGLDETLIRQITNELLKDFNPAAQAEVRQFLRSILEDQGAIIQATPEGMDLFNVTTPNNPDVRYVSYATASPPPVEVIRRISVRHLLTPLNKILYSVLWTLTARPHVGYPYHPNVRGEELIARRPLPFTLTDTTSDGVVPTLSQIWGEFRGVIRADHLDVIGHYLRGPFDDDNGADWFGSGAKFGREDFQWLWDDVADVLIETARREHKK